VAHDVIVGRPTGGQMVKIATRFDQQRESLDIAGLHGSQLGSKGWAEAWIRTNPPNTYYVFTDIEVPGVVVLVDLNSSERQRRPVTKWVHDSVITVGRHWSYRGETSGNIPAVESITAAMHSCLTTESHAMATTGGSTDRVAAEFERTMERLFGGDWQAEIVEAVRARIEEHARGL
jgi:hypothetical protein